MTSSLRRWNRFAPTSVIAFAEQRNGTLRQVAFETTTVGRQLADALELELVAVLLGPPGAADEAERLGRYGADRVVVAGSDSFSEYSPDEFTDVLARIIEEHSPKAVVFPASALGKDLAPRVAARLKLGLATEATEISVEDGRIAVVRPVYAGKVYAKVGFLGDTAVLSVRPRAFQPTENPRDAAVEVLGPQLDSPRRRTRVRRVEGEKKQRPDVSEAEIIVSGGRGMQGPEKWPMLEERVDALGSGATLGASRAVVDAGWRLLRNRHQRCHPAPGGDADREVYRGREQGSGGTHFQARRLRNRRRSVRDFAAPRGGYPPASI